jgi:putative toxin-antitoxin system antitoxin component (TIGR02293 family)
VKAYASTLGLLGVPASERQPRYRAGTSRAAALQHGNALVEVHDGMVPFTGVSTLANQLGIETQELLAVVGMPLRTAARRKTEGALTADEADRLLRVARVLEEATRVFGTQHKAAVWLRTTSPVLGDIEPYRLLDSDAGAKAVSDELIRIDFGDFA